MTHRRFNRCVARWAILWSLMVTGLMAQPRVNMTVNLHDLGTDASVAGRAATINMDAQSRPMQDARGVFQFAAEDQALCRTKNLSILLQGPTPYLDRQVPIEPQPVCHVAVQRYDFSLQQTTSQLKTHSYLSSGEKYLLPSQADKVIAYYEPLVRAIDDGKDGLEIRCLSREYYAFGLYYAFTNLNYATEERAREMYDFLRVNLNVCKTYTHRTEQYYQTAAANLAGKRVQILYSNARFEPAAELAVSQLDGENATAINPALQKWFTAAAGTSFMKAGEAKEVESGLPLATSYYQRAQKYLAEVPSPDQVTKKNLIIVNSKLSELQ